MNKLSFVVLGFLALSCTEEQIVAPLDPDSSISLSGIARMMSQLPLQEEHLTEVFDAVNSSAGNGYDEEYMMSDLMRSPGAGVGDEAKGITRAANYKQPLRDLIAEYIESEYSTRSGKGEVEKFLGELEESDVQIYWPYSENWDGKSLPLITYDPGYGAIDNMAYMISKDEYGYNVVDSLIVDEEMAQERAVWVINRNDDAEFAPVNYFEEDGLLAASADEIGSDKSRRLMIKSVKMLRNYDSWFGGASEFFIKCGAVDGFRANDEDELKLYTPSVTDMMVVVKRGKIGLNVPVKSLLLSEYTSQMEEIAFLIHEDDGGKRTSWKCSAVVKIKSKSTGFELDIPYRDQDDIVWRGQLAQSFFRDKSGDFKSEVCERFGDVEVTFELR